MSRPLPLSSGERDELQSYLRRHNLPAAVAQRMRIILRLADGATYREICEALDTTAPTISLWKKRYQEEGLIGLGTIRPGQPPQKLTPQLRAKILAKTQQVPPDGSTHWSLRKMAALIGVGKELIRKVWREADLKPHRLDRYMASDDPQFEQKAAAIIGLYLNPPQHAAVFCVDEKSAIQALDRLDRRLPLSPGRAERHGFEYYRHGTLSLFAALNPHTGSVLGQTAARHTSAEFVEFLEEVITTCPPDQPVHIILDNLSVHKAPRVREFLAQHPHVEFHFTPTYSSWMNQVEIWFSKLQREVIDRGIFTSVPDLRRKILRYIRLYQKTAKPFRWKYSDPRHRIRSW
ncbi:MAG TPA: IS630 family transposase [Terriglobales bacterium]|nr:IS630 family transposase [Terriglobales bacterium]